MANKTLFASLRGLFPPLPDTVNLEGAPAHSLPPRQALAQYAATGCFNRTFYASAAEQLKRVLELCEAVEPAFVARTAIFAREQALMKDMPALLCAWLSSRDARLHESVFARVIDSPRMLRTYVQMLRSGVTGRKSLGTAPKRLVRQWLAARDPETLFRGSAGQSPSLADIVRMVHPKPRNAREEAFFAYLIGRPADQGALPELVARFERFKSGAEGELPDLPLPLLTALPLNEGHWAELARNASWQMLRAHLNTLARHGVFRQPGLAEHVAGRLRDPEAIRRSRVFPYQILVALLHLDGAVPEVVREALQDALETATENVPRFDGDVVVCPDVSGSMVSPVSGFRGGATSAVRCVDVAALIASSVLRRNPSARVMPFADRLVSLRLDARDTVMTNAAKLAGAVGGGTNCSAPLASLNEERGARAGLVLLVSDNQSWADARTVHGTALMQEWARFRVRNPQARLVCLDLQPYGTTQAAEREDILNIGGFSDTVFSLIAAFAAGELEPGHWVARIESLAA